MTAPSTAELLKGARHAIQHAIETIRTWHGIDLDKEQMQVGCASQEQMLWDTYRRCSPEMKRITEPLSRLTDDAIKRAEDIEELLRWAKGLGACPADTDGDGNCGRPSCPHCQIVARAARLAALSGKGEG